MKRALLTFMLVLFVLTIPMSALAGRRSEIEDILDEWMEKAEDEGLDVFDWDIDVLDEDNYYVTYTIELDRGDYAVVAQSDSSIVDIDMAAWYEDEYDDGEDPFEEDTYEDNYPIVEFSLRRTETIVIEIWAVEFDRGEDEGYYCILIAEE